MGTGKRNRSEGGRRVGGVEAESGFEFTNAGLRRGQSPVAFAASGTRRCAHPAILERFTIRLRTQPRLHLGTSRPGVGASGALHPGQEPCSISASTKGIEHCGRRWTGMTISGMRGRAEGRPGPPQVDYRPRGSRCKDILRWPIPSRSRRRGMNLPRRFRRRWRRKNSGRRLNRRPHPFVVQRLASPLLASSSSNSHNC